MNTRTILRATALTLAAAALMACHKEKKVTPDPVDPVLEPTAGLTVACDYYADAYECGYTDYMMYFQIGEIGSDGSFTKDGIELALDILTNGGTVTGFPAGTYTLTSGAYNAAGILPSVPVTMKEYLEASGQSIAGYSASDLASVAYYNGSSFYVQTDANNWWLASVDEATLEVGVSGAQYTINVTFKADGDTYTYYYVGAMEINDRSQIDDPDDPEPEPTSFNMEDIASAYAYNDGHIWGDDTDDWFIYLYNSDETAYTVVEFVSNTGSDSKAMPTGHFSVPSDFYTVETIPAGTLCPIYQDGDYYYGTFYSQYDESEEGFVIWYEADSGEMTISQSGSSYKIALSFHDDYYGTDFTANYTGAVEVSDDDYYTTSNKLMSVGKPARKNHAKVAAKSMRRSATAKRQKSGVRRLAR